MQIQRLRVNNIIVDIFTGICRRHATGASLEPIKISLLSPPGVHTTPLTHISDIGARTNENIACEMDGTGRSVKTK